MLSFMMVSGSCCERRNGRKEAQKNGMAIWNDDRGEKSAEWVQREKIIGKSHPIPVENHASLCYTSIYITTGKGEVYPFAASHRPDVQNLQ